MKALFVSGYGGWGRKYCLVAENLLKSGSISEYIIYTHGLDSYLEVSSGNFQYKEHLSFENIYKFFLEQDSFPASASFEVDYGSLYELALSDRHLLQFTHDFPFGEKKDLEFIKNYTVHLITYFEKKLLDSKIDVVVTSVVANISTLVIAKVCKKLQIPYYNIASTRFPDRLAAYKGALQRNMEEISSIDENHLVAADKLIKSFAENLSKPSWVGSSAPLKKLSLKNIFKFLQHNQIYTKYKKTFLLGDFHDPMLNILPKLSRMKIFLTKNRRKKYFYSLNLVKEIDSLNFYFFPLQVDPEASTSVLAPTWIDQLELVKRIRINMPIDKLLLVKEHPAMIGYRNSSFYDELSKIPGVSLVSVEIDSVKLIKLSHLTLSITGTASFEAALLKKNSFLFGVTDFSDLPGIYCFDGNLKTLNLQLTIAETNTQFNEDLLKEKIAYNFANTMNQDYLSSWYEDNDEGMLISNYSSFLEKIFNKIK